MLFSCRYLWISNKCSSFFSSGYAPSEARQSRSYPTQAWILLSSWKRFFYSTRIFSFSDCLLWLASLESHSWDWDWVGAASHQNFVGTYRCDTYEKQEWSREIVVERWRFEFRCSIIPSFRNMVRMTINLSKRDELISLILRWLLVQLLRTRGRLRCRSRRQFRYAYW